MGGRLVGTAVGRIDHDRGWILRITLDPDWRERGPGSALTLRGRPQRLLVCATNSIGHLDGAFLRHGRFDYVPPIGPPDPDARLALWWRACEQTGATDIELAELVEASGDFTPADIGQASQHVAVATFEATVASGARVRATTRDYLTAVRQTRPTLSDADITRFRRDIESYQRV